jgi:predicted HTH domain antitoxin
MVSTLKMGVSTLSSPRTRINIHNKEGLAAMLEITVKLDNDVLSALRRSPTEFANEMRLAAAIHWYERGDISQEKAAQVAGLDRTDFLLALASRGEDAFLVDFADLDNELKRG